MSESQSIVAIAPAGRLPRALLLVMGLLCIVPALLPGDAPWINDEPRLIQLALNANQHHTLAKVGLAGTQGFRYGPAPAWVYQLFLLFSHNPVILVIMHALLMAGIVAIALAWLARSLRLWAWFLPCVLLSPYLWLYSRLLWDNSFAVPLSALALAAYAAFLLNRSGGALRIAAACLVLLPLVHLMTLALVIPIALHMAIVEWRQLLQRWRSLLIILIIGVLLAWPYLQNMRAAPQPLPLNSSAWWFPLLGARLLSASGLDYFLGENWPFALGDSAGNVIMLASWASLVFFGLCWLGMIVAGYRVVSAWRSRQASPLDHICGIALGALLLQMVVDGVRQVEMHPHYYNGTWIIFVLFAWLGADRIARLAWLRWLTPASAAALAIVLLFLIVGIHETGGTRGIHYGPTLSSQLQVREALGRYSPQSILQTNVMQYVQFPHALATLRHLDGRQAPADAPTARLRVHYTSDDVNDAHIGVEVVQGEP